MFGNVKKPPKPTGIVVRKVTVSRPIDKPPVSNGTAQRRPHSTNGSSLKSRDGTRRGGASANGHLDVARRADSKTASPSPSISPSRRVSGVKRKAPARDSPSLAPDFGESSEDEGASKRPRPSPRNGTLEPDSKRMLLDEDAMLRPSSSSSSSSSSFGDVSEEREDAPIIPGCDLTFGKFKEYNKYLSRTGEDDGEAAIAELQYPSRCARERFQLVLPSDKADYNPIDDIIESIVHICQNYFPEDQADFLTDEITGYPRRFMRANAKLSGPDFLKALDEFNAFIVKSIDDGTIPNHMRQKHSLPLQLVERILSQIYARTVSPQVNTLKEYDNGTDDVYGELLPRFVHQIFLDTSLRSDQVFVDLGSGVGNVVLQAALEIGCEAWGVEKMKNPATLAAKQLPEFNARCKRWSLLPGKATLIHGDFLTTPQIDEVLKRADVVLVNNQAFTPELNGKLTMKFMDLKDGCRIVSLRSFLPENWQIKERNVHDPRNLLTRNEKKEYFSESVSWTGVGGNYFVAVKDTKRVDDFVRRLKKAKAREEKEDEEQAGTDADDD